MTPSHWKPSLDTLDAWRSFLKAIVVQCVLGACLFLLAWFGP